MTAHLMTYAMRDVPRYTSYPTAPHFSAAIGAPDASEWLAAIPDGQPLSLYMHVPFCRQLCLYCGCHTKMVRKLDPVVEYGETLLDEIDIVAGLLGLRHAVSHLHWGGGTPSLMPVPMLLRLTDRLRHRFDMTPGAEHAIELDPRSVDAALAVALKRMGVNRVSFGVQDFTDTVQAAIGRMQPFDVVSAAVAAIRSVDITQISFDLMYGLPRQTAEDAARSAALAISLRPQRVALFGYAHVPWAKTHQRLIKDEELPDAEARIAQAAAAAAVLREAGYVAIGLDHFAFPDDPLATAQAKGVLNRNFQGYSDDGADTLIGFGASAISRLPQGFAQNAPDLAGYRRAIAAGDLATRRGLRLSADDLARGEIIQRVMCDLNADIGAIAARHHMPADALMAGADELAPMIRDGLAVLDGERISVTEAGRPFTRLVAAAFDAYLPRGTARHSRAV